MATEAGKQKKQNTERIFAIIAVAMCLVLGGVFCGLLFALNYQAKAPETPGEILPDSQPAFVVPEHPRSLVDFSLTDCTGRTVSRSELKGKILVVDFLFTSCSVVCPAVNGQMAQIQQLTTNEPDVRLLSLTVDPRDDTPDVLKKYGERFSADPNRWFFLTGDKTVLYYLIGSSFLSPDTNDLFGYMPGNFAHTERIAVVDGSGNVAGYFDGLNQNAAAAVVAEIAKLREHRS